MNVGEGNNAKKKNERGQNLRHKNLYKYTIRVISKIDDNRKFALCLENF